MSDIKYMEAALYEAKKAFDQDEVPVGAVVVYNGEIIARSHNSRINKKKPTGHAEINALEQAGKFLATWNLDTCDMYVTLEPCMMCMGAIIHSRIRNVYYGASEPRFGFAKSMINITDLSLHHYPNIVGGLLEEKCSKIMKDYFKMKREDGIKIKKIDNDSLFNAYLELRKEVFVNEQKVPIELEIDEYDTLSMKNISHIAVLENNDVIGSMRLIKKDRILKVGRLAIKQSHRHKKIGTSLLEYAKKQAINNGCDEIILGAQIQAKRFYERNGFEEFGNIYDDAGIDHVMMKQAL